MNNTMTRKEGQLINYVCELCSKTFTRPKQRGRKPRFCSRKCGDKVKANYYKDKYERICKECDKTYKTNSKTSEFCSKTCSAEYHNNRLQEKRCKKCNKKFKGKRAQEYCSDECKMEIRKCAYCNKNFKAFYYTENKFCSIKCVGESRITNEHTCEKCGKTFLGRKDRANRYCSRECFFEQVGYSAKEYKQLSHLTDASSYKRAEFYGVKREKINVLEVFERDKWICGICNEPVNARLPYPDSKSASLDHIIPLSKGGTHTYDNVQCSHLDCNVKKNDRLEVGVMV